MYHIYHAFISHNHKASIDLSKHIRALSKRETNTSAKYTELLWFTPTLGLRPQSLLMLLSFVNQVTEQSFQDPTPPRIRDLRSSLDPLSPGRSKH
jgi:hypothetical protein